jgi:large subunit ribosomal protein L18
MKVKNPQKRKQVARARRHGRVRAQVSGTKACPRLSVFRSAKHVLAQLIDDETGRTLAAASDKDIKAADGAKVGVAEAVGKLLAERGTKAGIKEVVFDRGGYVYHGRIKAIADGARNAGLKF